MKNNSPSPSANKADNATPDKWKPIVQMLWLFVKFIFNLVKDKKKAK